MKRVNTQLSFDFDSEEEQAKRKELKRLADIDSLVDILKSRQPGLYARLIMYAKESLAKDIKALKFPSSELEECKYQHVHCCEHEDAKILKKEKQCEQCLSEERVKNLIWP